MFRTEISVDANIGGCRRWSIPWLYVCLTLFPVLLPLTRFLQKFDLKIFLNTERPIEYIYHRWWHWKEARKPRTWRQLTQLTYCHRQRSFRMGTLWGSILRLGLSDSWPYCFQGMMCALSGSRVSQTIKCSPRPTILSPQFELSSGTSACSRSLLLYPLWNPVSKAKKNTKNEVRGYRQDPFMLLFGERTWEVPSVYVCPGRRVFIHRPR